MGMTTKEVAEILNDPCNVMARYSMQVNINKAVTKKDIYKLRSLMSAAGKSRRGFSDLDEDLKKAAIALLESAGYLPAGDYKTMTFTIVKV